MYIKKAQTPIIFLSEVYHNPHITYEEIYALWRSFM